MLNVRFWFRLLLQLRLDSFERNENHQITGMAASGSKLPNFSTWSNRLVRVRKSFILLLAPEFCQHSRKASLGNLSSCGLTFLVIWRLYLVLFPFFTFNSITVLFLLFNLFNNNNHLPFRVFFLFSPPDFKKKLFFFFIAERFFWLKKKKKIIFL